MDALTSRYREQSLKVRSATLRDLHRLWPALRYDDLDGTFPALLAGVSPLIQRDRAQMATLAALYLRAHRLQHGVPGQVAVKLAAQAPSDQVATSLYVTSAVAAKVGVRAGYTEQKVMVNAFVQAAGAVGKLVLNAGRETITRTTTSDPQTLGWQRVGVGNCDLCSLLLSRGAVYSEESVDFETHDHCACSGEPVYR